MLRESPLNSTQSTIDSSAKDPIKLLYLYLSLRKKYDALQLDSSGTWTNAAAS